MIESHVENSYRLKRAATLASVAVLTAVLFMTVGGFFGVGSLSPMASMLQPAYATVQQHGIGMLADCEKVLVGETNDCTFSVRNDDDFLDSMVLESVQATFLAPFPGAPVTHVFPAGGAMVITGVTGYVPDGVDDCEAGGTLPCEIPPTGRVFFADTSFTMTTAGSFPYNTQAGATDQCDGAFSGSCSTTTGGQAAVALVTQFVANPDMELTKTPDVEKAVSGDTINYTIELANTGNVDIDDPSVSDPLLGGSLGPADSGDGGDVGVLDVGETWQWIRAYEVTEQDCGDLDNTATATGEFQLTPIERSASATVFIACPDMELTKTPDVEKAVSGDTINYTIELSNTGNADIPISDVSDPLLGGSLGPADSGDAADAGVLNVGETWQWIRAYEVTEQDCGDLDNTVTATAEFQLTPIERSASATVFIACPDMELTKVADVEEAVPGDTITYTFELSNTGNADIPISDVSDDHLGPLGAPDSGDDVDAGVLNVGETWTWVVEHVADVDDCPEIINEATATGEFQLTPLTRTATETVTVICEEFEGLTPGFWKANAVRFDAGAWVDEEPGDDFNTVFGTDISVRNGGRTIVEDPTLLQALSATGGVNFDKGVFDALARHCVAAKLNAENPDVTYFLSAAEVIQACGEAINDGTTNIDGTDYTAAQLKDLLDQNNNLGADISQHWPN